MLSRYVGCLLCYWLITAVGAPGQDTFVVAGRVLDAVSGVTLGIRKAIEPYLKKAERATVAPTGPVTRDVAPQ